MFFLKEVKYKDILDIKSLHIKNNAVTFVVGKSGSGKSTLLKLLNKLISCDSGEILYKNQLLSEIKSEDVRRNVVMIPQSPVIFKGSIEDNLVIGMKFSEKPIPSESKLLEALSLVKLEKDLNEDAEKLSGGEKQRLAIARVVLMDPETLLLDEPSSALDESTELAVMDELINYAKKRDKTLIIVTHSNKLIERLADEIIEIKKGMQING